MNPIWRKLIVVVPLSVLIVLLSLRGAVAQTADETFAVSDNQLSQLLTQIVNKHLPTRFEETKDWGGQKERWDGIKFRREGWKLETQRRKKMVNHGTWKKYSVALRDPNQVLDIKIQSFPKTEDEKHPFEIQTQANLNINARQAKWVKGVQLYSISANGHANVRLKIRFEAKLKLETTSQSAELALDLRATEVDLTIDEFRIDRISKVGGELTQQLSKRVRSKLEKKMEEKERKLIKKINRQIEKNADRLRISLPDFLSILK